DQSSLVVYESRNDWMNKLFSKLGIVQNSIEENVASSDVTESINDDDLKTNDSQFDDEQSCDNYIKNLDPKDWKNQDHYKVLALSKKRIDATESEIKKSCKPIILQNTNFYVLFNRLRQNIDPDCHYFFCITKAYEILSDPTKRRSYDMKKPVPLLGEKDSSFDEINNFYNFWYNFESWREYSYLDEEEKEKGENRYERRYIEKQNKAARNQRKKEEMQRIRQLVDNAYQCDPRVSRFKEDEKKRKNEIKLAKQASIKAQKAEEERLQREKEEEEIAAKRRLEEEERQLKEQERKHKEAIKKRTKREIKSIENILEQNNYFTNDAKIRIDIMKDFDKLCKMSSLEQIVALREQMESLSDEQKKEFFLDKLKQMNQQLEEERKRLNKSLNNAPVNSSQINESSRKHWSYDDVQLLIKAVKLFPAGTHNRWSVIANFINDKSSTKINRNHRDVLEKAKELQSNTNELQGLKDEVNKNAFKKLEIQATQNSQAQSATLAMESVPSERYDAPSSILEVNDEPWTNEEQQLLEGAMKTYPSSYGVERWNLIAECIPNRSRADCIKRYKYLVQLVKAKNAAKQKAAKK
ncbi:dnaJ-like protein subfamily C member 2-like protein, partial [Sarcoptes scabiei]